jgi:hypothetical protein
VRWFTIEEGLRRINAPDKFIKFALGKMQGSKMRVATSAGISQELLIRRGAPQGDPLSPLLFIIATDLLHAGLYSNPHDNTNHGYLLSEHIRVADKCYADDTIILSSTKEGLGTMNAWVNEFCAYNFPSMNADKSVMMGRNDKGEDDEMALDVISNLGGGPAQFSKLHTQSASSHIKYLGLHINMDLTWEKELGRIGSMVGRTSNLITANHLSTRTALYLINAHLKPKLEYRMRHMEVPDDRLSKWDKCIIRAVNRTINHRVRIKRDIITLATRVQLPSQYYWKCKTTELLNASSEPGMPGQVTRLRLQEVEDRCNRFKGTRKQIKKRFGISLTWNDTPLHLPDTLPPHAQLAPCTVNRGAWMVPRGHVGVWGNDQEQIQVQAYTDGSTMTSSRRTGGHSMRRKEGSTVTSSHASSHSGQERWTDPQVPALSRSWKLSPGQLWPSQEPGRSPFGQTLSRPSKPHSRTTPAPCSVRSSDVRSGGPWNYYIESMGSGRTRSNSNMFTPTRKSSPHNRWATPLQTWLRSRRESFPTSTAPHPRCHLSDSTRDLW